MTDIYIASREKPGSIHHFKLSEDGILHPQKIYPIDQPAFLCIEGDSLYALLREPFLMQSGIAKYHIAYDGTLTLEGEIQPVHGAVSADLTVYNDNIYVANYLSGSTVCLPDKAVLYQGHGPNQNRQDCSHPHCVCLSPDKKQLLVADLGTDCIYVHDLMLQSTEIISMPEGCGPRQLIFSKNGQMLYCITELASTVEVLKKTGTSYVHIQSVSTVPPGYIGENSGSAIQISTCGRYLYASNRGHDSIAIFLIEENEIHLKRVVPCWGSSPRHFQVCGNYLICGNELSNNVQVFSIQEDMLLHIDHSISIQMPWCILCRGSTCSNQNKKGE